MLESLEKEWWNRRKRVGYFRKVRGINWVKGCEKVNKIKIYNWIVFWCSNKFIGGFGERNFNRTYILLFWEIKRGCLIERRDISVFFVKVVLLV